MVRLPTVVEFEVLKHNLLDTAFDKKSFKWPEGVKPIVEVLTHLVTSDVDDVVLEDNGWIWAKPAVLKNGNGERDPIFLQCMDDRTPSNHYVKRDDYYQMSWHPYVFLDKIAHSCGSRTHTSARLETARILDVGSVDDLSYAFFYGVRYQLFSGAPHESRTWPDAQSLIDWSPPGFEFPKFSRVDHRHREWLAAAKRYDVWKSITEQNSKAGMESVPEATLELFLNQTNTFWWFGYAKEYFLRQKLMRKALRYQESA